MLSKGIWHNKVKMAQAARQKNKDSHLLEEIITEEE